MSYSQQIRNLFVDDIYSINPFGLHGSSIESVIFLSEHGFFPSRYKSPEEAANAFYFYIQKKGYSSFGDDSFPDVYAETSAFKHFLVKSIGFFPSSVSLTFLSENPPTYEQYEGEFEDELKRFYLECKDHQIEDKETTQLLKEAWSRRGVIYAISKDIMDLPYEQDPEEEIWAIKINVENIDLKYIKGIMVSTRHEREILDEILND